MIIRARIRSFIGAVLFKDETKDVKVNNAWYTCQCYFNQRYKKKLLENTNGVDMITISWENKNYEFTTRTLDDDSSRKEGRKKRSPQHRKAA